MKYLILIKLLTFVVCGNLWAAPHEDAPAKKSEDDVMVRTPSVQTVENMAVTQPPMVPLRTNDVDRVMDRRDFFYNHKQSIDLHGGVMYSISDSSEDPDNLNAIFGFGWLLKGDGLMRWEVQADLAFVGYGHVSVLRRRIYNGSGAFRPYYRYGGTLLLDPDKEFAAFSDYESYTLRAGGGFEFTRRDPESHRLDLDLIVGIEDMAVIFTYGLAFGIN
jgi:hypothetical protein